MNELTTDAEVSIEVIDLDHDYQVKQWTEIFDCGASDLAEAVQIVGPQRAAVKRYLRRLKG